MAETYALDDLADGLTTLVDQVEALEGEKLDAFDEQNTIVGAFFTRADTDVKDIEAVFNAMNVYYISEIEVDRDVNDDIIISQQGEPDWSVYDDCFDHIQYDVGHLAEYAPSEYNVNNNYSSNYNYGSGYNNNRNYGSSSSYQNNNYGSSSNYPSGSNSYSNNYQSGGSTNKYNTSYGTNNYQSTNNNYSNNYNYNSGYNNNYRY